MRIALGTLLALAITYGAALLAAALAQSGLIQAGQALESWQEVYVRSVWTVGIAAIVLATLWISFAYRATSTLRSGAGRFAWYVFGILSLSAALVVWRVLPPYEGSWLVAAVILLVAWVDYHVTTIVGAPWSHAFIPPGRDLLRRLKTRRRGRGPTQSAASAGVPEGGRS